MKLSMRNVYIALFAVLYFCVGLVSTIHSVAFFSLANVTALGILLACTFEIGQAAVLFSILTDKSKKTKIMPWCLMTVLTAVQILGNVFSSYKYLITNSTNDLRFFKEPIFVWTTIPDDMANVILTYIIGAILPIVALCMTGMLEQYLNKENTLPEDIKEEPKVDEQVEKKVEEKIEKKVEEVKTEEIETNEPTTEAPEESISLPPITTEDIERVNKQMIKEYDENHKDELQEQVNHIEFSPEPTTEAPKIDEENPLDFENQRQSHFINL